MIYNGVPKQESQFKHNGLIKKISANNLCVSDQDFDIHHLYSNKFMCFIEGTFALKFVNI